MINTAFPSKAFFSFQHSWASLFRALLLPEDRSAFSSQPFRSCDSFQNLSGFEISLQRLSPFRKAVSLRFSGD
jgi:hypothetical protein